MPSSPKPETQTVKAPQSQSTERNVGKLLRSQRTLRRCVLFLLWVPMLAFFVRTVAAANGLTLAQGPRDTIAVPQWLYLATGGATIGASALLASFVTDRAFIRYFHDWHHSVPLIDQWRRAIVWTGRGLGVATLIVAVYLGFVGPQLPTASFTVLVTFAGGRAALPMVAYLFGNVWPVLNPWRTISLVLPSGFRAYPASFQRWPAVVGLLVLVWVEVIFPVSTVPTVLATAILSYSVATLAGAALFGPDAWFENADPLSVLFRLFGSVAPVQRGDGTFQVKFPGSEVTDPEFVSDESDVAFIIALIWELTYSGFITTSAGAATVKTLVQSTSFGLVDVGIRAVIVYTALFVGGYAIFFAAYWYAGRLTRRRLQTYVTARTMSLRFAPPLLAIAAGYHLAHYVGLFVSLSPALLMALSSPLTPPANPLVLTSPSWFGGLTIAFVLIGHLLAIWMAHTAAYDLFPSRLDAIRSQYPFVAVMIGYTIISLWILSLPGALMAYFTG